MERGVQMDSEQLEIRLMPHIYEMEQRGVNLDGAGLAKAYDFYFFKMDELDDQIHQRLGKVFDIDSNEDLANAIQAKYPLAEFFPTPGGARSVAKDSLTNAIQSVDKDVLAKLLIRGALATSLRTFIGPWHRQFQDNGRLFIKWNQFRNYTDTGARTGRLSSSPNLQNIPVEWEQLLARLKHCDDYQIGFDLPQIRQYIIPDPGKTFVGGDYQAQEMRLLAHFAGGALLEHILANPTSDIHQIAADIAQLTRPVAKTLGFAVLYGAGVGRVAASIGKTVAEAAIIKAQYLRALPEIKQFSKAVTDQGKKLGHAITTINGRKYVTDSPKPGVNGQRTMTYEYKLVNYKIQGSAAEQTKLAMLNYVEKNEGQLVLSVHDQLVAQVDIGTTPTKLGDAMTEAFAERLRYQIVVDLAEGPNFAKTKGGGTRALGMKPTNTITPEL